MESIHMDDVLWKYFFWGMVALAVIAVVGWKYVLPFLKGRLKLELPQTSAIPHQPFRGRVTLRAKKPIRGLLKVSLVGRERRSRRDGESGSYWFEVHRQDQTLEERREFESGFQKTYDFELIPPTNAELHAKARALQNLADLVESSGQEAGRMVGRLVRGAMSIAGPESNRIYWHVESRLDAEGVDLYTKKKIRLNQ
jgi:hypothetical protein